MKAAHMQIRSWMAIIAGSAALIGHLCVPIHAAHAESSHGEALVAMALFGGDDHKPVTPPPTPPAPKPQASPAQGSVQPAGPTGSVQAPAAQPAPAGSTAKPAAPGPTAVAPTSAPTALAPAVTPQGEKTMPMQAPVGGAKESPKPSDAAVLPTTEASDGYSYDPQSRRDPFQPLTKAIKEKVQLDVPPLQRYQLSDVKILGIIWGGYGYYGLIQTPDGKGYTVKEGMLMGTNNGVIKAISDKAIIVSEPTIDFTGKKIEKEVELLLRPKEVS